MLTLAFETTSNTAGVALLSGDHVLGEQRLDRGTRHGVGLIPAVADLLSASSLRPADVTLVAVSLGPGSFTGIRVGLATARSFAHFTRSRLIGIPTMDALLEETPADHARMGVAIFAGRDRAYGAIYDLTGEKPETEVEPALLPVEEWAEKIRGPAWLAGDCAARYPDLFATEGLTLAPSDSYPPRPTTIALLAMRLLEDPDLEEGAVDPIYLQLPMAKTIQERKRERRDREAAGNPE